MQFALHAIRKLDFSMISHLSDNGFIWESNFEEEQLEELWEACWEAWSDNQQDEQVTLGSFMALFKAYYPNLPGKPEWAMAGDPEEEWAY
ncbi:MAG: hypothetical protein ETSY2_51480 [Candidatus Entotheonella gemina]|uniref:Uncharacterized protein n=1 Tax=Candidatus Entotheonella gemina TaxID=1429439 RepID=W4L6U0_9BACT|nr:MAG: hypothetical protein ETSY2_51480 [Candidatus Entotheonella gemina]